MLTLEGSNSISNNIHTDSSQLELVEIEPSLHESPCNTKVLLITRVIFFLILAARFYLQMVENKSLLDIFLFLTNVGFSFTIMFYLLTLVDYVINEVVRPKVSQR